MKTIFLILITLWQTLAYAVQGPPSKQGPNPGVEKVAKANEKEMKKFEKKKYSLKTTRPHEGSTAAKHKQHTAPSTLKAD